MAETSVLVTRPLAQSGALCQRVEQQGFSATAIPMIEICPFEQLPARALQTVIDLDCYQHVIVVSTNAVRCGMPWIERYWPQLPVGLNWYAIGVRTAGELASYGLEVVQGAVEMNSEGLLSLPELQSPGDQRVLIIKGEGGRTLIGETLSSRGARVDQLAVYRRQLPAAAPGQLTAALDEQTFAALLISSGEGLHNMLSLLDEAERHRLCDVPIVVPGARVATLAEQAGFREVFTAQNATDDAIMEALVRSQRNGESSGQ